MEDSHLTVVRNDPPELRTLLALLDTDDQQVREDVRHSYYYLHRGDPNSVSVQLCIWLAALHRSYGRIAKSTSATGAPDLKQLEDAVTRALQKRPDEVAVLSALDQTRDRVTKDIDNLFQERLDDFRKEIVPEKEEEERRRPAWINKTLTLVSRRSVIAAACLLLGMLPGTFLAKYVADQSHADSTSRLGAMIDQLPDFMRLQLSGNIVYHPPKAGQPGNILMDLGQKLHPISAEVKGGQVSIVVLTPTGPNEAQH